MCLFFFVERLIAILIFLFNLLTNFHDKNSSKKARDDHNRQLHSPKSIKLIFTKLRNIIMPHVVNNFTKNSLLSENIQQLIPPFTFMQFSFFVWCSFSRRMVKIFHNEEKRDGVNIRIFILEFSSAFSDETCLQVHTTKK